VEHNIKKKYFVYRCFLSCSKGFIRELLSLGGAEKKQSMIFFKRPFEHGELNVYYADCKI